MCFGSGVQSYSVYVRYLDVINRGLKLHFNFDPFIVISDKSSLVTDR